MTSNYNRSEIYSFMEFSDKIKACIDEIGKYHKVSAFAPSQNYFTINKINHVNILFHKHTHADKAIPLFKQMGLNVISPREKNIFNAYFKYFITIKE